MLTAFSSAILASCGQRTQEKTNWEKTQWLVTRPAQSTRGSAQGSTRSPKADTRDLSGRILRSTTARKRTESEKRAEAWKATAERWNSAEGDLLGPEK